MWKRPIAPPRNVKLAILLAVLLLAHALPAEAALLCSYSGPATSDDYLELSDFEVTGPEPLRVGDTVTASFTLNAIEVPVQFGEHGVFVAARDPDGINRDFGHVYQNSMLQGGESINFKASMTVDKEGEWIFWPAYYIKENLPDYYGEHFDFGPDRWHACYLGVVSQAQPDLTVEKIFWNPSHPEINEQVTVEVIVKNRGDVSSGENGLTLRGCCDLTGRVSRLEPGETTTIYFEDSPLIFEEPGEFEIIATVDDSNEISESNEENNERSEFITIEETIPILSVSISTDPVHSGESGEITVRVTSNGDPVPDASVYLSATIGDLNPDEGVTDDDGEFVSIFTAPTVETEEIYTIYAEAEIENLGGMGSVSDLIIVTPNIPPVAYIEIHPNPVEEGESVTFKGWGEDEDGEVVECRWTFPDGRTFLESGSSSWETLDPKDVQAGWYSFAVMDDDEVGSEEVSLELRIAPPPTPSASPTSTPIKTDLSRISEYISKHISDPVVLAAVAALMAITVLIHVFKGKKPPKSEIEEEKKPKSDEKEEQQYGSISATSDPDDALIFMDGIYKGKSQLTIDNILIGPHLVGFVKSGYLGCERAVVNANQTTHVHCDLIEIPEIKLELSSKPTKIPADGKSESMITIAIEDKDGRPIPVPKETPIVLETDIGVIDTPVKIPAGCSSTTSTLTSSTSSGTATVNAEFEKVSKLKNSITVEFLKVESG